MVYYVVLTPRPALGMIVVVAANLGAIAVLAGARLRLLHTFAVIFLAAWVGHTGQDTNPSFFKDLQFLLIGPLWLLAFIYRRRGWRY